MTLGTYGDGESAPIVPEMGDVPATFDDRFEIRPGPPGTRFRQIRTFSVIDSTNRYLKAQAMAGERDGLVAIARHQSAGRGRHGRVWDSKPGAALLLSVLLQPRNVEIQQLCSAMGLAITDACKTVAGFNAQLKWPNDVVISNEDGSYRKLAGVLAELVATDEAVTGESGENMAVVIGAGVNLNWGDELPEALKQVAVSADELAGGPVDTDVFTEALLRALHERLARPDWLLQAYRERCATLGQHVNVTLASFDIDGQATAINDEGALLVKDASGVVHVILAGDVTHLRPESR